METVQEAAVKAGVHHGNLTLTLEQFLSLFPVLSPKISMRIFRHFSERFSVRDMAKVGEFFVF